MIMTQVIIVHSTDGVTTYPDPKTFLESLPNYLKIESVLPNGLSMIAVGQDAPDQQYQDIPWLQLDDSNNPIALKYYNGVEWAETRPYKTIQAPYEGLYVQYGQITYTHIQGTGDTFIDSQTLHLVAGQPSKFLFPEQFKAGTTVHVQITPVWSSIFRDANVVSADIDDDTKKSDWILNQRKTLEWALGTSVDTTGFNLMLKCSDIVAGGLAFTFNWMAMGEKA